MNSSLKNKINHNIIKEIMGFEPMMLFLHTYFQDRHLRPLSHISENKQIDNFTAQKKINGQFRQKRYLMFQ